MKWWKGQVWRNRTHSSRREGQRNTSFWRVIKPFTINFLWSVSVTYVWQMCIAKYYHKVCENLQIVVPKWLLNNYHKNITILFQQIFTNLKQESGCNGHCLHILLCKKCMYEYNTGICTSSRDGELQTWRRLYKWCLGKLFENDWLVWRFYVCKHEFFFEVTINNLIITSFHRKLPNYSYLPWKITHSSRPFYKQS